MNEGERDGEGEKTQRKTRLRIWGSKGITPLILNVLKPRGNFTYDQV
jgi:hypothetical protein